MGNEGIRNCPVQPILAPHPSSGFINRQLVALKITPVCQAVEAARAHLGRVVEEGVYLALGRIDLVPLPPMNAEPPQGMAQEAPVPVGQRVRVPTLLDRGHAGSSQLRRVQGVAGRHDQRIDVLLATTHATMVTGILCGGVQVLNVSTPIPRTGPSRESRQGVRQILMGKEVMKKGGDIPSIEWSRMVNQFSSQ